MARNVWRRSSSCIGKHTHTPTIASFFFLSCKHLHKYQFRSFFSFEAKQWVSVSREKIVWSTFSVWRRVALFFWETRPKLATTTGRASTKSITRYAFFRIFFLLFFFSSKYKRPLTGHIWLRRYGLLFSIRSFFAKITLTCENIPKEWFLVKLIFSQQVYKLIWNKRVGGGVECREMRAIWGKLPWILQYIDAQVIQHCVCIYIYI